MPFADVSPAKAGIQCDLPSFARKAKWIPAFAGMTAMWVAPLGLAADAPPSVASGRIERLADFPSRFVPPRNVDVWLPDGYPKAQPYDVLYMHDGQMLFDAASTWNHSEWQVDEIAGALIASGRARPFIVVGVWNGGLTRHQEYFPQKPFEALPPAQQRAQYALEMAPGQPLFAGPIYADRYLKFLVEEVKAHVDAHYAVARGREHTFTMGSSMGALISLYALAEYPQVFGGAACLSTHWPGSFAPDRNPLPAAFFAYVRAHLPRAGAHRIYFDYGTEDTDAPYEPMQLRMDALMERAGYRRGVDWATHKFAGAGHSEQYWRARVDLPLRFLLG
jgi:predicted alpha/beta superfamily hydrolase